MGGVNYAHSQITNTRIDAEVTSSKGSFYLCCNFGRDKIATFVGTGGHQLLTSGASVVIQILRLFSDFSSPALTTPPAHRV